jgi:hypothetical protein
MVGLRKHRQWQDLGHEVIFLIGDGTGQAGDPTGKKKTREKFFTKDELRANAKDYLIQASKIVRFDGPNPIKILYNGDWLNKLTKTDILNIAQHFSVQQLASVDIFYYTGFFLTKFFTLLGLYIIYKIPAEKKLTTEFLLIIYLLLLNSFVVLPSCKHIYFVL